MATIPHILHIDDDEHHRMVLSSAFLVSGVIGILHSLSSASNALLYLNQRGPFAAAPRPRLIIVDLDLPRSEGRQFHELIETDQRWKDISMVVLMGPRKNIDIDDYYALDIRHARKMPQSAADAIELIRSLYHDYLEVS